MRTHICHLLMPKYSKDYHVSSHGVSLVDKECEHALHFIGAWMFLS